MVERVLRLAAAVLLAVAIVGVWYRSEYSEERSVERFVAAPTPLTRDALAAKSHAGRKVSWSGEVASMAVAAEAAREPGDRFRLSAVSADGSLVRDALGPLDSLPAGGGTLTTRTPRDGWIVAAPTGEAFARPVAGAPVGRVVVLGRAGWESKFVIAALEEEGWGVDARLSLGARTVVQGDPRPRADRHAAVVVLDTTAISSPNAISNEISNATDAAALVRFVRAGGGLVLAGEGASWGAAPIRSIAPARSTRTEAPETRELTSEPLYALPLHVLGSLRDDALVVESRGALPAVAARRERAGRVVQSGYAETWRWRMQGEEQAMRDHRLWWSDLVGSAASETRAGSAGFDASGVGAAAVPHRPLLSDPASAPLAELVHALGPATPSPAERTPNAPPLPFWLGLPMLALLVAEWGSRRARGAA